MVANSRGHFTYVGVTLAFCAYALVSSHSQVQEPNEYWVTCTPDRPVAMVGETVRLTAWSLASNTKFEWSATVGTLVVNGNYADWSLKDVASGAAYGAQLRASAGGVTSICNVRLLVIGATERSLSGRTTLAQGQSETTGFGLYSYLLFMHRPSSDSHARYQSAIAAYMEGLVRIEELQRYVPRRALNVTYIPVDQPFAEDSLKNPTGWALDHYDYARAMSLGRVLDGPLPGSIYIVSCVSPLATCAQPALLQDLSAIPPSLVRLWVREFLSHAAQQDHSNSGSVIPLGLRLRTAVSVMAQGIDPVSKAIERVITFGRGLRP